MQFKIETNFWICNESKFYFEFESFQLPAKAKSACQSHWKLATIQHCALLTGVFSWTVFHLHCFNFCSSTSWILNEKCETVTLNEFATEMMHWFITMQAKAIGSTMKQCFRNQSPFFVSQHLGWHNLQEQTLRTQSKIDHVFALNVIH